MIAIKVNSDGARRKLHTLGTAAADGRKPLRIFYQLHRAVVFRAWGQQRPQGGTFRGKVWPKIKDQYTRKTDGVTVPVYGGVPRIRAGYRKAAQWTETQRRGVSTGVRSAKASGNVSGKLRRSNRRWTPNSVPYMDTAELRNQLYPARPDIDRNRLRLSVDAPDWRVAQFKVRPLLFFNEEDQRNLNAVAEEHLRGLANDFNRG